MLSRCFQAVYLLPFFLFLLGQHPLLSQGCPTLNGNATLTSGSCAPGSNPCALCPGDQFTLTATGMKVLPGDSVKWYFGTTPNFNPYNGQGTYLGYSPITVPAPNSCNPCLTALGIFVDACGSEPQGEFAFLWSGGGFFLNELSVDYAVQNNAGGPENEDIGGAGSCGWQQPSTAAINTIQNDCPGTTIVPVGPGGAVPPTSPVIFLSSAGYSQDYNFNTMCLAFNTIYVIQSSCDRSSGAYSNGTSSGLRNTVWALDCGCNDNIEYNCSSLVGNDGAFVANTPIGVIYGNVGCTNFPSFPPPPGGSPPPITIEPFTAEATQAMCNGGPYYVVGTYADLPSGCTQTLTNYLQFDVDCPNPTLGTAEVCESVTNLNLIPLQDPNVPNGQWSGPGVSGTTFNANGLSGPVQITFTPDSPCGTAANTTITVNDSPQANLTPIPPVCQGATVDLEINFIGQGPWSFQVFRGATQIGNFSNINTNPFVLNVTPPLGTSTYSVQNVSDSKCAGTGSSIDVTVIERPTATLTLSGPDQVCDGENTELTIVFDNGNPPYEYNYSINGNFQGLETTGNNPHVFNTPSLTDDSFIQLTFVSSGGCEGTATGNIFVEIIDPPEAELEQGIKTICLGESDTLLINFIGVPPFTFDYTENGILQPAITTIDNPYELIITPAVADTYVFELTSVENDFCAGSVAGQYILNVNPAADAVLSGDATICPGQNATLTFNFSGAPGPYTVSYNANNTPQTGFTTNTDPFTLNVTPTVTTTYEITNLTAPNGCPATFSGDATVIVGPTFDATIGGTQTICNGQTANLTLTFTGTGPYTVDYSMNGMPQGQIVVNNSPFSLPVTPLNGVNTFVLTKVTANGCDGTLSGQAVVTVNPGPSAVLETGSSTLCQGQKDTLLVTLSGGAPYNFTPAINGVNQPSITTSTSPYQLILTPAVGTNVVTIANVNNPACPGGGQTSGTFTITVRAIPNTMLTGDLSICAGSTGKLIFNYTGTGPWTANYTADGIAQPPLVSTKDPDTLNVMPNVPTIYILTQVSAAGCISTQKDTVEMSVSQNAQANMENGEAGVCAGTQDSILVTFGGGGPYTFTYTINSVLQPAITTPGPTYNILYLPTTARDTFRLASVTSPGCPGGNVSGQYITFAKLRPTVSMSNLDTTLCGNGPVPLKLNFGGPPAPWTMNYTANGVAQPPYNATKSPDTIWVNPAATTTYVLTAIAANGCTGTATGTAKVTVKDTLKAVISGGGQICKNGTGTYLVFTFSGQPGPYTYQYKTGSGTNLMVFNRTTNKTVDSVFVNPPTGGIYELVFVRNNECYGVVDGAVGVFVFAPSNASFVTQSAAYCDSAMVNLEVNFNGTAPFILFYDVDGVPQVPDTTSDDPYFIPVKVFKTTTYKLTGIQSPGCTGNATGSVTLTVNYTPKAQNIDIQCNAQQTQYSVTFDVTGVGPFTVTGGTGSFVGNTFTSTLLPVGSNYSFTVKDSKNCNSVTVSGVGTCGCQTDAGTMSPDTVIVCENSPATVAATVGAVLEPGDTLLYVLHQNLGNPPNPIIAWNDKPIFSLQAGMKPDSVYYISAVVGNKLSGRVDLLDPCFDISSTPVIFHKIPTAVLKNLDTLICGGETIQLQVELTGLPPFTLRPLENGIKQPEFTNINGLSLAYIVNPLVNTTVVLDSLADAYCPVGIVSGKVNIEVTGTPRAIDITTACQPLSLTYTVSFKVTGGKLPLSITGMTGKFTDSTFTSNPIPYGTNYEGFLTDIAKCGEDTIMGVFACPCVTDAGQMTLLTPQRFCEGDSAKVKHLGNQFLDGNDRLVFVLHTSMDSTIGTVLATNTVPNFPFIPGITLPGTTYYISPLAGNILGANNVDLSDTCADASVGTPVIWTPKPTAEINIDSTDVCPGVPTPIPVKLTGTPPYMLSYTSNGSPVNATALSNNFGILANLQQTTTYILTSVKDANGCVGTVMGQAVVTVHQPPDIQNVKVICSPDNLNYTLEFDVTKADLGPGFIQLFTGPITGNYNETTGKFVSNPIPKNTPYNIFVSDAKWNCGQDSIKGVSNCGCSTKAGTMLQTPIALCIGDTAKAQAASGSVLEANDALVYFLVTTNNPATWTILATNTTPNFAYIPGTTLPGTTYFIVAAAANAAAGGIDLGDPCRSFANGPTVLWRVAPSANISGSTFVCIGGEATLTFTFTGTGPFNFNYTNGSNTFSGNATGNSTTVKVKPTVTTTYTLSSVNGIGNCAGTVSGNATVTVREEPTAKITADTVICPGSNFAFPVNFTGTPPFKFVYSLNGVNQPQLTANTNTFTIQTNNVQGKLEFALVSVEDANCPGKVSGKVFVDIKPVAEAILSGGKTICVGDSAILTIDLKNITTGNITIGGGATPIQITGVKNGQKIVVKPTVASTYTITAFVPTGNNCPPKFSGSAQVDIGQLTATGVVSNYGGYNVSCPESLDGSIKVTPGASGSNVSALWSNSQNTLEIKGLAPGTYTVTLTNTDGCKFVDSFKLSAPPLIDLTYRLNPPTCTGDKNGNILIQGITGGVGPYRLTVDGKPFNISTLPANAGPFAAGNYAIEVIDANGCSVDEVVNLTTPVPLTLALGRDTTISFGDSVLIAPKISTDTLKSFIWEPLQFLKPATSPDEGWWAKPPFSQTYRLTVVDTFGCRATDDIVILVNRQPRIFVPNIIRPESDLLNDFALVFAGPEVVKVRYFRIFDRWGDQVFTRENFLPNVENLGWNGKVRGDKVTPGVFVYVAEVEFFDGSTKIYKGDITVIR